MIKRGIMILCMIFAVLLISLYVSAGNIIVKNGELNVSSDFFVDTNSLFVNSTSGNVGIGTTGPATPLEINRASDGAILKLTRQAVASWDFGIRNTPTVAGLQAGSLEILPQNGNTDFSIGSQIFPAALVVKNSGNVGIGTTAPTSKLHVIGKATFTGGVDPPYISFSDESHESIQQYAKEVEEHEKVMQFWNGEEHRIEVYVISEDRFYTITGELIEE